MLLTEPIALAQDDPELPLTEDDYRRRKGHPNFKTQLATEKTVIKAGKPSEEGAAAPPMATFVVSSGLPYGRGEGPFHWLFKSAWLLYDASLPVLGDGNNVIPAIHVADLAFAVVNVVERLPERRYILAVWRPGCFLPLPFLLF